MPLLPTLHALSAFYCRLGFAQQVTAITQAPGFPSLSPCVQNIAVAVIDDSTSPECPGGSPPHCFCWPEAASQKYSDQISTDILNSCLTSPQPEAMQAATVFAAYCSLGDATTAGTTAAGTIATSTTAVAATAASTTVTATAAKTSSLTSLSSSYSLSPSSSETGTSTPSAAQGASSTSKSTSGPTSDSNGGEGLDTGDIVARGVNVPGTLATVGAAAGAVGTVLGASHGGGLNQGDKLALGLDIGIGIPGTLATIAGTYYTYKAYKKKEAKEKLSRVSPLAATYPGPALNITSPSKEDSTSGPMPDPPASTQGIPRAVITIPQP